MNSREWSRTEQVDLRIIAAQLDMIRENEKEARAEITAVAKTLPGYENLISIKGIGPLSAAIFLNTIGDIRDFAKAGKLAAYLGITPRVSQSNDSQRVGRITKQQNRPYRPGAMCARCHAIQPLSARGTGKAIIATAKKLLNTIFYALKENWVFEDFPNFQLKALQLIIGDVIFYLFFVASKPTLPPRWQFRVFLKFSPLKTVENFH